ncbi:T-cell-specific guanine nucleotide triphosphate-binding protein 1-like isoform X1 [Enhydra lutris kenyoni]|uniref:T-cell-specific guanine nucleotide triphosphate-binding protein 1-like isoform X1 n=2 Tax=Enhydra lutris kenyoni TaxID=391180 RepID=A0A2Y9KSC1_ENHLU|nr:T-cell-specific guanine nucleotide triphosphate-binding protein 1-like isoform X1 [Enhydra lutris kenyoni]
MCKSDSLKDIPQSASMDQFLNDFLVGKNFQQLATNFVPHYTTLISKVGGILSQENLGRIQATLKEAKLKDVADIIEESLVAAENAPLDVAVIGESGTGKSSFINALRGLSYEEEGSASVGVVETTKKRTPYQHPKYPNVTFWDLPGTGTPNFQPHEYLERVEFATYDFFIIISSSRFSLNDASLVKSIKEIGKKFYFVRTKVDNDLYNEEKRKPTSYKRERVLQKIRDNCLANLSHIGVPEPCIFLVSNFDLDDFDFPTLEETLLKEFPVHKCYTFALLLPNLSEASIEMKRALLKEKIWLEALKSSALSFIPFMAFFNCFDFPQQEKCLKHYQSHFGLDEKSLKGTAEKLNMSLEDIKSFTKSLNVQFLVQDDNIGEKAMKCAECYCSVNGGLPSTIFQFFKIYFLHLKFINTVADDAKILLNKTLESLSLRR